jgi:Zn-dependent peptidase ImmA (M78 family)/plasmid maintenance system antidote protein VapI
MAVTREIISGRVRAALESQRMQQQELAHQIGLPPSSLSRALSNQRDFKSREIAAVADVLGVSPSYLLGLEDDPQPAGIAMAARRQGGASRIEHAIERLDLYVAIDDVVSGFGHAATEVGFESTVDARRLPHLQGEEAANEFRRQMDLQDRLLPPGVLELARWIEERLGFSVAFEPHLMGLDGACVARGSFKAMLLNSSAVEVRRRWTLAHELAHLLLGDDEDVTVDENVYGKSPAEKRANGFAAAFLMPRSDIRTRWAAGDGSIAHLLGLLDDYNVSVDALAYRLHNTDCVNAEGRDKILAQKLELNARRAANDEARHGVKPPGPLIDRAIAAYVEGAIGVRPIADLLGLSAEELLDQLEPDNDVEAALDDELSAVS